MTAEDVKKSIPPGLKPESFGLIHEYYTTTAIAEAIETLCPELASNDGIVRALEPSAGIGRLIRAFSPRRCLWPGPEVKAGCGGCAKTCGCAPYRLKHSNGHDHDHEHEHDHDHGGEP